MSTKLTIDDIEVPEGMLKVAVAYVQDGGFDRYRKFLAVALLYLAEHPMVPTQEDTDASILKFDESMLEGSFAGWFAAEWQRRMFLKREPELPKELKEILCDESVCDTYTGRRSTYNKALINAYELGKKAGTK